MTPLIAPTETNRLPLGHVAAQQQPPAASADAGAAITPSDIDLPPTFTVALTEYVEAVLSSL